MSLQSRMSETWVFLVINPLRFFLMFKYLLRLLTCLVTGQVKLSDHVAISAIHRVKAVNVQVAIVRGQQQPQGLLDPGQKKMIFNP